MKMLMRLTLLSLILLLCTCKKDVPVPEYQSRKVVFILVDGARWQETWGDTAHLYQPYLRDSLRKEGIIFTNFYNNGPTLTIPGHTALLTGHYQNILNNGAQYPEFPSLLQLYLEKYQGAQSSAQIIASKDKIEIFKTCEQEQYMYKFTPLTDCGVSGNGSGYRHDSVTFKNVISTLSSQHPDFLFVQFREPDYSGHLGDYTGYLEGIRMGDKYAWEIWKQLQNDPYYRNNTTFIITNDHGRHLDGILGGFSSHGDDCEGCRHINLFMAGPDLKKNEINSSGYEQIDVHKTLCRMLGLNGKFGEGKVMRDIYR